MAKIEIKCKFCGKIFEDYKSNKRVFCSSKCFHDIGIGKQPRYVLPPRPMGYKHSEETKRKISISHMGIKSSEKAKELLKKRMEGRKGPLAYNWKGGLTNLRDTIKREFKYRQWRSDVFTRDNFTCQKCGQYGGFLHVHHIKYFSIILKEYNIKNVDDALPCEELWNINNGITLCKKCHHNLHRKVKQ